MTARIEAIRRRTGSAILARPQDYEVGCIMISQPVFFARDDWVADHADWHPRIQGGKTIDVARGDGQRVLAECLERTARLRREVERLDDNLRRYGAPQTVQPRLGQGTFRIAVTSAYRACAVSGEHSLPAPQGRARAPVRRRRRARAPQRAAAARRHPLPRATPATSPSRRTTASASATTSPTTSTMAASTSASPAAPSPCCLCCSTSPTPSCSTGTRLRCSRAERHPPRLIVILVRQRPPQLRSKTA